LEASVVESRVSVELKVSREDSGLLAEAVIVIS